MKSKISRYLPFVVASILVSCASVQNSAKNNEAAYLAPYTPPNLSTYSDSIETPFCNLSKSYKITNNKTNRVYYTVKDTWGRVLLNGVLQKGENIIPFSDRRIMIYYVEVTEGTELIWMRKLIAGNQKK